VTTFQPGAFYGCSSLTNIFCQGNAPSFDSTSFSGVSSKAKVYFLSGTTGWNSTYDSLPAAALQVPNYTYTDKNGSIIITGYTGTGGVVTIPGTLAGLAVTSIGSNAFGNCTNLTSATIPASVVSIGNNAFWLCTNLTSVNFQGNAPSLGSSVFSTNNHTKAYYLPSTTGWESTYGGIPAVCRNGLLIHLR